MLRICQNLVATASFLRESDAGFHTTNLAGRGNNGKKAFVAPRREELITLHRRIRFFCKFARSLHEDSFVSFLDSVKFLSFYTKSLDSDGVLKRNLPFLFLPIRELHNQFLQG